MVLHLLRLILLFLMYIKELNVKPESAYRHIHLKANTCKNMCCILQQQGIISTVPDNYILTK